MSGVHGHLPEATNGDMMASTRQKAEPIWTLDGLR
jgi:hypothetical protein